MKSYTISSYFISGDLDTEDFYLVLNKIIYVDILIRVRSTYVSNTRHPVTYATIKPVRASEGHFDLDRMNYYLNLGSVNKIIFKMKKGVSKK